MRRSVISSPKRRDKRYPRTSRELISNLGSTVSQLPMNNLFIDDKMMSMFQDQFRERQSFSHQRSSDSLDNGVAINLNKMSNIALSSTKTFYKDTTNSTFFANYKA
jgi:hypothetical protein